MPNLIANQMFKLYAVSEIPDKNGWFSLMPFDNDTFNQTIDEDMIESTLARLVKVLYGRGGKKNCHEITKNMCNDGTISINIEWHRHLKIKNIVDKIGVFQESARFFVVVNAECKKYQWVVARSLCTVYSDVDGWDLIDDEVLF